MRKLLDGGVGTVEDQDEVKCVCVRACVRACVCVVIASMCYTPIPGWLSHWTVYSFIRQFGGVCSYGRRGGQHCCGHLTKVTCLWWESWWTCTKRICFRRKRYVLHYLMHLSQCTYFVNNVWMVCLPSHWTVHSFSNMKSGFYQGCKHLGWK